MDWKCNNPELAPASTPTIDWYAVIIPIYSMQLAILFDAAQLVPIIKTTSYLRLRINSMK